MNQDDFYKYEMTQNPFGMEEERKTGLNTVLIDEIINKRYTRTFDLEALNIMLNILKSELVSFANAGDNIMSDDELRFFIKSIRIILKRHNFTDLKLPFSSFSEFYDDWRAHGYTGNGSWEVRRRYVADLLNGNIGEIRKSLDDILLDILVTPLSEPVPLDNWEHILSEVEELRVRFSSARTPQDFSAVGTACVRIIEGISRVVYVHDIHGAEGYDEPSVAKTDIRIGQIITVGLGGSTNEELRSLARSCSAAAHKVKHSTTPNALQAGIACDAVILLCSIINRIENERINVSSI